MNTREPRWAFAPTSAILAGIIFALASAPAEAATQNVTGFGVVPNDETDDSAAIQRAIDASKADDTVALPAGTFLVSQTLHPKSGITIRGAGPGQTILKFNPSRQIDLVDLSGLHKVELTGFTLDGNGSTNAHDGIFGRTGGGHSIHHLAIQNLGSVNGPNGIHFIGTDGNYTNGVNDCTIADNTIRNIGTNSQWAGGIRLSWGCSHNQILRNIIDSTGRGGIFGNDGAADLVIRSNTIAHSGRKAEKLGIEVWGSCDRCVIEDNHIDHWLSISGSACVAARRNVISDTSGDIGYIGLELIGQDLVVTDNEVNDGQQIGVSVSNDANNERQYCAYNTVRKMVQWGTQLQGDRTGARMFYYYKNKFLATQRGNKAAIYPGADGRGFRFNGNCQQVTLDSNEISNNPAEGIELGGKGLDQISLVNNIITDNGFAAVAGNPGVDLEWTNNTVARNGKDTQLASRGFVHPKPIAEFSCPDKAVVGKTVTFASTAKAFDGSIAHVLWDFGDGVPSTKSTETHAYAQPGTYRVTLIVWDNRGRGAICERTLSIDRP